MRGGREETGARAGVTVVVTAVVRVTRAAGVAAEVTVVVTAVRAVRATRAEGVVAPEARAAGAAGTAGAAAREASAAEVAAGRSKCHDGGCDSALGSSTWRTGRLRPQRTSCNCTPPTKRSVTCICHSSIRRVPEQRAPAAYVGEKGRR